MSQEYLQITNPLRSEKTTQFLISFIRPYNPVSVNRVSRWLKKFLRLSGIDTSIFTRHSTRAASASKAKQVGLSLPEILERGQWTNKTAFETFYNKPILDNSVGLSQRKLLCFGDFKHSELYRLRFYKIKIANFIRASSA